MKRRLFFGFEIDAPWPDSFPAGRVLEPQARHLTVAFLGSREWPDDELTKPPLPSFKVGGVALFDAPLFLPKRHPRLVAWHMKWLEENSIGYIGEIRDWLGLENDDFLSHVTLCRGGFDAKEWKRAFEPLPVALRALHLYESHGYSKYSSLFSIPFLLPFEEIEHTADVAYLIRGESMEAVELHAQMALAYEFPPLIPYLKRATGESIVPGLNELVRRVDGEIGAPFKAVSFHGEVEERDGILEWEMIIDV